MYKTKKINAFDGFKNSDIYQNLNSENSKHLKIKFESYSVSYFGHCVIFSNMDWGRIFHFTSNLY